MTALTVDRDPPVGVAATVRVVGVGDDDRRLARLLLAGDDDALAEAYDRWSPLVSGLARRVTGDATIAEDVMQEVFVHLWEHPGRYDPNRGGLREISGPADVRIEADVVDFCRLAARRLRPEQLQVVVSGDAALAEAVLVGAGMFAA